MASKHTYTAEQVAWILANRDSMLLKDMATAFTKKFGVTRTERQLQHKCAHLGIKKPHQFPKGLIPWNKGKKTGIQNPCIFQPGQKPANTVPVGSLRRNNHGFIQYKFADGTGKWRNLHLFVWEKHNRPLKPGEIVLFLDGNKDNLDISNLVMVNRADYAVINIQHNFGQHNPPEINQAIITMVKLDQTAKRAELRK